MKTCRCLAAEAGLVLVLIASAGCTAPEPALEATEIIVASSVQGDLAEQLALARKEGIITSQEEMRAFMGKAPPEAENAWPVLQKIQAMPRKAVERTWVWTALESGRPPTAKELQGIVSELQPLLDLAEEAADREVIWYEGTEADREKRVYHMARSSRRAAFALTARSELSRAKGSFEPALTDIRRVMKLSDLAFGLGDGTGLPLADKLREGIIRRLICWAAESGPDSPWVRELEAIHRTARDPDPKAALKTSLLFWISRAERQRQNLASRPKVVRSVQARIPDPRPHFDSREFRDLDVRKLKMVKSFRGMWQTISNEWPSGIGRFNLDWTKNLSAKSDYGTFVRYAMANPDASQPFSIDGNDPFLPIGTLKSMACQKILLEGVIRVLKSEKRSELISMKGLVSPIDGSPLTIEARILPPPNPARTSSGRLVLMLHFGEGRGEPIALIPLTHRGKGS